VIGCNFEVVAQLFLSDKDSIQELLDLRVARLGVKQDFTDEVDRTLDLEGMTLLLPFHHDGGTHHLSSGHDIQQEWFPLNRWHKDRGLC
jgi:hypothetical protein